MSPIRRILVPLDGSEFAEQALPRAAALAGHHGAELVLVQALDLHSPRLGVDPMEVPQIESPGSVQRAIEAYLLDRAKLAGRLGAPAVRVEVLDGPPVEAIATAVEATAVDLVVLTTHGRGALRRLLLGGVAHALLHRLTAPMLLIRPADGLPPATAFRRVLLPVDPADSPEQAIASAERVTEGMKPELTVLAVVKLVPVTGFEAQVGVAMGIYEEIAAHALRAGESCVGQVVAGLRAREHEVVRGRIELGGSIAGTILGVAEEIDADLIALATHGRRGARGAMLGSVADQVVRGAGCAVLVQRPVAAA